MGQLLVRELDDEIIKRLKQRAAAHGRSAEAEHRAILVEALSRPIESVRDTLRRFRENGPKAETDSADIIRALRDGTLEIE